MRAFHQQAGEANNDQGHSLLDLQRSIIRAVRAMPGNQVCADCGSTNGMKNVHSFHYYLLNLFEQ